MRAKNYHHGDLRTALLEGVAHVIREKGVAHVSLREVARDIGVSHGAPAHHFASKRALLTAFAAEGYKRMGAAIRDALVESDATDPRERITLMGRGYFHFSIAHREYFEVMYRADIIDTQDAEYVASSNIVWDTLGGAIAEVVKAGHLAPQDVEAFATTAWSIAHGLGALYNSKRLQPRIKTTDPREIIDRATRIFVEGAVGWPKKKPRARKA